MGFGKVEAAMSGSTIQQQEKKSAIGRMVDLVKSWFGGS
jgi:hypothetical protein